VAGVCQWGYPGDHKTKPTGRVNSWDSFNWPVTLRAGSNTVRVVIQQVPAGEASRPNIDRLDVFQGGSGGSGGTDAGKGGVTAPTSEAMPPEISPGGGGFSGSVKVGLKTSTPGARIYYTTNGKTPTTRSSRYTRPKPDRRTHGARSAPWRHLPKVNTPCASSSFRVG
jgi:hypothetical protein